MQMRLILLDTLKGVQAKACLLCQRIIKVVKVEKKLKLSFISYHADFKSYMDRIVKLT